MQSHVHTVLERTKSRVRFVSLTTALGAWCLATLIACLVFVIWDHSAAGGIPATAALTLRIGYLAGSVAWLSLAFVWPLLRRINDVYAAWLIERTHPELRNSVMGAVQLARHEELPGSVRWAIEERAALDLRRIDVSNAISTQHLRALGLSLGAGLAAMLFYAAVAPKSVLISIERALGMPLPPPTATSLVEVLPADGASALRGEPVVFRVVTARRRPASVYVRFSLDDGQTWAEGQQLVLRPLGDAPREFEGVKAGLDVQRTMLWQVIAGDVASEVRRLRVRPPAAIDSVELTLTPPAYTRLPAATQPSGDVEAIVGTRVEIRARTNVPVRSPVLVLGEGGAERQRLIDAPSPDRPTEVRADFIVSADESYRIFLRDAFDRPGAEPVRYQVYAHPDRPPVIEEPGGLDNLRLVPGETLALQARASDDFGLMRAAVSWRRASAPAAVTEIPLPMESGEPRETGLTVQIPIEKFGATPGERIEWWISAWDNRTDADGRPAYQRGDGAIHVLDLRTPEELAKAEPETSRPRQLSSQRDRAETRPAESAQGNEPEPGSEPEEMTALAQADAPRDPPRTESESERPGEQGVARPQQADAQAGTQRDEMPGQPEAPSGAGDARDPGEQADAGGRPGEDGTQSADALDEFLRQNRDVLETLARRLEEEMEALGGGDGEQQANQSGGQDGPGADDQSPQAGGANQQGMQGEGAEGSPANADADEGGQTPGGRAQQGNGREGTGSESPSPQDGENRVDRNAAGNEPATSGEPGEQGDASGNENAAGGAQGGRESSQGESREAGTAGGQSGMGQPEEGDSSRDASGDSQRGQAAGANGQPGDMNAGERQESSGQAASNARASSPRAEESASEGDTRTGQPGGGSAQSDQSAGGPQTPGGTPSGASAAPSERAETPEQGDPENNESMTEDESTPGGQSAASEASQVGQTASGSEQTADERAPGGQPGSEGSGPQSAGGEESGGSQSSGGGQPGSGEPQEGGQTPGRGRAPPDAAASGQGQASGQTAAGETAAGASASGGQSSGDGKSSSPTGEPTGQGSGTSSEAGDQPPRPGGETSGGGSSAGHQEGRSRAGESPSESSGATGSSEEQPDSEGQAGPQAPSQGGEGKPAPSEMTADSGESHGNAPEGQSTHGDGNRKGQQGDAQPEPSGASAGRSSGSGGTQRGGQDAPLNEKPAELAPTERSAPVAEAPQDLRPPGTAERVVEALDRALRRGTLDPQLLDELGWTQPQAEDFVAEFKRRREASLRGPAHTDLAGEVRVLARPGGQAPAVRRGQDAPRLTERRLRDSGRPDRVNELLEPGRQRIAPQYRTLLEAYYRGLASQPAGG